MKKTIITAVALLLGAAAMFAFDWKVQSNESLRSDMLAYAGEFARDAKGTKAGKIVNSLIRKQSKTDDAYSWIADSYEAVKKLEAAYGPVCATGDQVRPENESKEAMIRRRTLQLLDYPIHVPEYLQDAPQAQREAFAAFKKEYLSQARAKALAWLLAPAPEEGVLRIMKVYNMGFMLRTAGKTVLLDLRWDGSPDEADFIARQADLFLLTHPHGDHYSKTMLDALQKAGVPVVLPKDLMPEYKSEAKHVIWGNDSPVSIADVSFTSLKGNQGEGVPNNVYTIEFDGWRIVDAGDNADDELEKRIAGQAPCDIVLAASWNNVQNLLSAAMSPEGAAPLLIPAHENEFGHGVDHRESYHELYQRKDRLGNPDFQYPSFVLMDIGENIEIHRQGNTSFKEEEPQINLGYGSVRSTMNTYAISQVKVTETEGHIYTNMIDYLRGRVAGLDITDDGKITIRGITSLNGPNDPLILVDGTEIQDITTINPMDVSKVDVMKDASASIYGSRGANGVILITLKH